MNDRWMAEIRYRTPIDPDHTVTFDEFAELGRIIEQGPDWHEIENITITLNRSARSPSAKPLGSPWAR
jgi:hypothetical protein